MPGSFLRFVSCVEEDRPFLDVISDQYVPPRPRVLAEDRARRIHALDRQDHHRPTAAGERAGQDDGAGFEQRVDEARVLVPLRLLSNRDPDSTASHDAGKQQWPFSSIPPQP